MMMSVTPDQSRKVGTGLIPSPSPFLTPRPERRRPDSRGSASISDWTAHRSDRDKDKDKEVNVQVLLRCRPLSEEEQRANVPKAISCNEQKREVTVLQSVANKQVDRVFTFDKVFGPKAQQRSIYDQAIAPIVNEVLEGFNCTVFAYGQTGTGKTYTMEGGMRNKGGDLPAEAGVIPRAVRQIFDTLESQNADYSMKVTFLELYNEEITDLLAPEEALRSIEDRQKKPISLMEDGKGCVVVRGLEEEPVYSANDIYTLLERGAAKRRTADTLLNKRSSRSHAVFSITVYVKEAAVGEEELIKCGKLNLVDLAGSENISRSGAREVVQDYYEYYRTELKQVTFSNRGEIYNIGKGRAREAGEINKSLLTLGRVINALVEHSAHIPYRDSKLTRLLRDSLGGKTKTCIIATISPSAHSLEETLSTLDYAHRAKNIKNKPEANQKMSKAVLLKDLYLEIERMKEDVRAARERNGVYIPHDRFVQDEAEKKARIEKIEQLESDLEISEKQVDKYRELYVTEQELKLDVESQLKDCEMNLEKTNKELLELQELHRVAISTLKEKEFFISKLQSTENSLIERAKELRTDLLNASEDITSFFTKLDQKDKMEAENQSMVLTFHSHLDQSLKHLHKTLQGTVSQQEQQLRCMEERVQSFLNSKCLATKVLDSRIKKITETYTTGVTGLKEIFDRMQRKASSDLGEINATISSQMIAVDQILNTAVLGAKEVIDDIQKSLEEQKQLLAFSTQQQAEGLHQSLVSAQVISNKTVDFLHCLHIQASKSISALEDNSIKQSQQLASFEKMFKEEAAREEQQALDSIAGILAALTSRNTAIVSEAARNIQDSNILKNQRLQNEMINMQQVSSNAKEELSKYVEKVERHFTEETFSAAESKAMMDNFLQECSKRVEDSRQDWENVQLDITNLNKSRGLQIECTVKERINRNHDTHEEFLSASSATDADFDSGISDLMIKVNDSLMQDREIKEEMDSMTSLCLDQLKSGQENHCQNISNIRSTAEKRLTKDYLVDQHTGATPKRRHVEVPSVASIEEMRTPGSENLKEEKTVQNRPKWSHIESKIPQPLFHVASPLNRTPFNYLN